VNISTWKIIKGSEKKGLKVIDDVMKNEKSIEIFYFNNYCGLILQDNYITHLSLVNFVLCDQIKWAC